MTKKTGKKTTKNNTKNVEAPGTLTEQVGITVEDLKGILSIIETAQTRGAFKANEMMIVGSLFNKVQTFVNAVAAQQNVADAPVDGPSVEKHNAAMEAMAAEEAKA